MLLVIACHLVALLLAALALWFMRHETTEKAATLFDWTLPSGLAVGVAAFLVFVSPGQRLPFWAMSIGAGFAIGLAVGMILKAEKDFALNLVRVHRTWDGVAAAGLLLILALTRFVSTDLMGRQSHGFGVLAAAAVFLASYLVGRVVTLHLYTAPRSIHLDMVRGQKRHRTA